MLYPVIIRSGPFPFRWIFRKVVQDASMLIGNLSRK